MHSIRYLIGSLTLLATGLAAVWVVRLLSNLDHREGMPLQIEFRETRGLRAGADVRYRGVTVGTVLSSTIAADGGKAVVEVLLDPAGAAHACVNSSFWIVTPRFGGITGSTSGLDTLVRDAYIAFDTPAQRGSPMTGGNLLTGLERPPAALEPDTLGDVQHGDLLMTVLVPENHGLRPGSPVSFRGMHTGDVRRVDLAKDGSHVEVTLRIARQYRQTVTDKSTFWVARPAVTGALLSGFAVTDLPALLSPYVSYYADPGIGVMVQDGHRAAAEVMRPDFKVAEVPAAALRQTAAAATPAEDGVVLVRIVYAAVERDTFSPDDSIQREGTGLLFLDGSGRTVVVTARSLVDGSYTETDWFGSAPTIAKEQLKVMLPSGTVLRAARVWVEPGDADLAALVLADAPPDLRGTTNSLIRFDEVHADLQEVALCRAGVDGAPLPPTPTAGVVVPKLSEHLGAVVKQGDRIVGIYGRSTRFEEIPKVVPLPLLPQDLRPQ